MKSIMVQETNKDRTQAYTTVRRDGLLSPPVGTSDWARFSRTSYCVDKTLILKDLIDSESTVVLFTRPRRFGKTTMLEMIRAFYEGDASLFHDKKIWAAGEKYQSEEETEDLDALAREARRQIDTREYTTEMLADFAAHNEQRDILKFGMTFYKKNLVVCKDLPRN